MAEDKVKVICLDEFERDGVTFKAKQQCEIQVRELIGRNGKVIFIAFCPLFNLTVYSESEEQANSDIAGMIASQYLKAVEKVEYIKRLFELTLK